MTGRNIGIMIRLKGLQGGMQMDNYIGHYKKLILVLSILFCMFSLGDRFENAYVSGQQVSYHDEHNHDDVDHLISPLVEKISLTFAKGNESRNKEAMFLALGHNKIIELECLLYISLWVAIGSMGVFYKIIEYIQDKDGPKRKISSNHI